MSLAQCYQEIGRLQQRNDDKDAKIAEIDQERATLSVINEEVHDSLVHQKVWVRKAEHEINRLTEENVYLEKERQQLELTVKQLKEQLAKAQKTIKVQSDQIGQIGSRTRPSPEHPGPVGGPAQSFQPVFNQVPQNYHPEHPSASGGPVQSVQSAFNQPSPHSNSPLSFSALNNPLTTNAPPPVLSRQPSFAFTFAPLTMSREASSASFNQTHPPSEMRMIVAPPTTHDPPKDTQLTIKPKQDNLLVSMKGEFAPLFEEVEAWALKYTNIPDEEKDSSLPSKLINHIKSNTNSDLAPKLLASSSTRYLAVARVINHTIVHNTFKPALIKGFGPFFDKKYADLRLQLHQVGMPLPVRRAVLVALTELVDEMTKTKGFNAFLEESLQSQIHRMWQLLEPLFTDGMKRTDAWKELTFIWHKGANIGMKVLKKASNFNFDFPPSGPNSHWNQSSMVNRGPHFNQQNYKADRTPASVCLAVSPTVTETDFMLQNITPETLYKAHVLLDTTKI